MSERLKTRFTIYQFLFRLRGFKPAIWRRLRSADCTLEDVHESITVAFGFDSGLPFQFRHGDRDFEGGGARRPLPHRAWLSDVVPVDHAEFQMTYAAGGAEPWRCGVSFEGWFLSSFDALYPFCVEGERGGVPDRNMGPSAFRAFLKGWEAPDPWARDRHLAWIPNNPSAIDVDAINAQLQPPRRPSARHEQGEPLIRLPLDIDEWVSFWDWAVVDDDERERMMCTASRGAVWLYLPEALDSTRNLIMAARDAESEQTRDLLDRLIGRLHRHVVLHRLRNQRRRTAARGCTNATPR